MPCATPQSVHTDCRKHVKSRIMFNNFNTFNNVKKVELKKLEIQNFRSKTITLEFGKTTNIRGRNRSGKSTIKNAVYWLLTGTDDENRTNYNLFDNTVVYTHETSVPTVVKATIVIDDLEYELTRTAKMGWQRPRGQEEYERKANDDYSFEIDGIKRSATEFRNWIEENIMPTEMLKCALNTQHFLYVVPDWKTQRKFLAQIAGEIKDEDLKGDYTDLFVQFKKYSPDELRERLKNIIAPLKRALGSDSVKGEKIVMLETLQSNLINIDDIESAEKQLAQKQQELDELRASLKGQHKPVEEAINARSAKQIEISKLQEKRFKASIAHEQELSKKCAVIQQQIDDIVARNSAITEQNERDRKAFMRKQKQLAEEEQNADRLKKRLDFLREENIDIKSRVFDAKCSFCGSEITDPDQLSALRAKFDERQSKDREYNKSEGIQVKMRLETAESDIKALRADIEKGFTPTELLSEGDLGIKLQECRASYPPFEQTDECKAIDAEIASVVIPEIPKVDTSEIDTKIAEVEQQMDALRTTCSKRTLYNAQIKKIAEVKNDIKNTACERAQYEKIQQQLTAYEQEKADIVGQRVNQFFEKCSVSMFSEKKDGSLAPDCVITMDGRRSTTLNKEGTITAGIDVSNAFCKFYNVNLPLFVDDYESISSENAVFSDRQVITLSVADGDLTTTIM